MTSFASPRMARILVAILALGLGIGTLASGLGATIDRTLDPWRFAAMTRKASGRVVVVEMDAASAAAIKRWPWSREHYARVVDRLRAAGAAYITFDVDLSSPSTRAGDEAFAASLARSDGMVALPTFGQQARADDRRSIDSLPLPAFRDHVSLASVSIAPDPDGAVRQAPFGTVTDGLPRPSLSAYIARRSGRADDFFPIDYTIDPASLPRLSFVAVERGAFAPNAVAGRDVLIGATAIEMGDRYATPQWGVIPGVIVQALAAETLIRGVPVYGDGLIVLLLALTLASIVLCTANLRAIGLAAVGSVIVLVAAVGLAQYRFQIVFPFAPGLILLVSAIAGRLALEILGRFQRERTVDEATGLPNRRAMVDAMGHQSDLRIAVAQIANREALVAVLGGDAGRDLSLRVAERLRLVSAGAVFRLGDSHLAFVVPGGEVEDELFSGLRATLLQPVEIAGRRVDAQVTLGLANTTGAGIASALTAATMAAEAALRDGIFWTSAGADLAQLERQISLMGELDDALEGGGIEVHYQPKLSLADDRIVSVEALVRWRHPTRGFIGPDLFIPLAERTDRIEPLTLHVMRQVMIDLAAWRTSGHDLTAAVNISAKLIAADQFNASVADLLAERIVAPESLVFEVTESATLVDPVTAVTVLERYRALGIAISMDDYGTGQSTLTYLRQLPLSELKIDRSFVQHAHANRADGVLVRSTIDLAHELGLKVVAEGVEDDACLTFLRAIGCDMVQGYLISRPLPATALVAMLAERREDAA